MKRGLQGRYSGRGFHVCRGAGAGAQGDGAVPGRAADQQGRPEGGPPVPGEHPQYYAFLSLHKHLGIKAST